MNASKLFDFSINQILLLEKALRYRGFLVETREENDQRSLYLSDNSYYDRSTVNRRSQRSGAKTDVVYLERLGKRIGLRICTDNPQRMNIEYDREITPEFIDDLFSDHAYRMEAFKPYHHSLNYFLTHKRGTKVPVEMLDTGIAYLIKAFSSVGIDTWCSCSGHGIDNAVIFFTSEYFALWCGLVMKTAAEETGSRNRWDLSIEKQILIIRCGYSMRNKEYFCDIFKAAEWIYRNRMSYLLVKENILQSVGKNKNFDAFREQFESAFDVHYPSHRYRSNCHVVQ